MMENVILNENNPTVEILISWEYQKNTDRGLRSSFFSQRTLVFHWSTARRRSAALRRDPPGGKSARPCPPCGPSALSGFLLVTGILFISCVSRRPGTFSPPHGQELSALHRLFRPGRAEYEGIMVPAVIVGIEIMASRSG